MLGRKCIIRTYSAGVHYGEVISQCGETGKRVRLKNAIRIWRWERAASLSQLAMEGVKNPNGCRFAMPVDEIELTEAIELIPCRKEAIKNLDGVTCWKK